MGLFNHLGTFLLFAATILLLIATISAPIIRPVGFLSVKSGAETFRFGTFGYCQTAGNDQCTSSRLGYNLVDQIASLGGSRGNNALNTMTKSLILHPIALGLSFIAFLIALLSDRIGYIFASGTALLAFIIALVAMVIDFIMFGVARRHARNGNLDASYGTATWLTLVAVILLFLASFFTIFQCCCGKSRKDRRNRDVEATGHHNEKRGMFGRRKNNAAVGTGAGVAAGAYGAQHAHGKRGGGLFGRGRGSTGTGHSSLNPTTGTYANDGVHGHNHTLGHNDGYGNTLGRNDGYGNNTLLGNNNNNYVGNDHLAGSSHFGHDHMAANNGHVGHKQHFWQRNNDPVVDPAYNNQRM